MRFEILPFDAEDARHAGEVRAALERAGTPIGGYDVLIAGQALARDLILVTHNMREFERVAGLRIEDWEGLAPGPRHSGLSTQNIQKLDPSCCSTSCPPTMLHSHP